MLGLDGLDADQLLAESIDVHILGRPLGGVVNMEKNNVRRGIEVHGRWSRGGGVVEKFSSRPGGKSANRANRQCKTVSGGLASSPWKLSQG